MKKKASYMSESEIPAEDKHLYKQVGGKWILDVDLFDDDEIENLVVPGLTNNKNKLKQEKTDAQTALKEANDKVKEAQEELDKLRKPGTKILTKQEAEQLEQYIKLGPAADLAKAVEDKKKAEQRLQQIESEKQDEKLAKEANIDQEAFVDFKRTRGDGLSFSTKTIKEKDAKGKEKERVALMVQYEEEEGGVSKKREQEFTEYAKAKNVPQYLVNAIYAGGAPAAVVETTKQKTRFHVPDLSLNSTKEKEGVKSEGGSSFVERKNQERSTRRMPWTKVEEEK